MTTAAPLDTPDLDALTRCVVALHERGDFIHDPSPSVVALDDEGNPFVPASELEKRSQSQVPRLAVGQLWSLVHGLSPRRLLRLGEAYCRLRDTEIDLEEALVEHAAVERERCFHTNRDFKTMQLGDLTWHVRRELLQDAHLPILEAPDAYLEDEEGLLKSGRGTTLALTPGRSVLKRFNLKKKRNILKHRFAATRARSAFQKAYALEIMGIRTPRAVAFADRSTLGLIHSSYLLVEEVPEVMEGGEALRQWNGSNAPHRRRALSGAGSLIGRLHGAGFANRDLKSSNLLATTEGEIWLIDLDGVEHVKRINEEVRIKNLRRMVRDLPVYGELTVKDRLRFLRSYTRAARAGSAKEIFRKLAAEPLP